MNDQPVQPAPQAPINPSPQPPVTSEPRNIFVTEEISTPPISTVSLPTMPVNDGIDPPPPPTNATVQPADFDSGKKGMSLKFPLIILVILVFLAAIGFGVWKFVLPMLSGKSLVTQKETTITWWGLWEDQLSVSPIISEYQAAHPNVKINYVKQSPQDYRERLTNSLAKGNGPDIFSFHNSWVPMFKNDLDVVPASVMSVEDFNKNYYPVMTADLGLGNGLAGIPREYDGLALFVNEELFNQQGKTVPKTWDELRETARSLTIKDETGNIKQAGVALGRTENVDHWQEILALLMIQNGVRMNNPAGQNATDALSFFSAFSAIDGVWDQTLPPSTIAFSSGKAAMYLGSSWRVFEIKQQNPTLKFKVAPVPQLAKISASDPDVSYATYWVDGVWKRSENKAAAWEFVKYLSSQETLQKMYTESAKTRLFGMPYPRVDMASLVSTDPIVSVFVTQAPAAKSWYLQSRTFDGVTGINSQINKYFEDAINALNTGKRADDVLLTVNKGVIQVLSSYGLVSQTQ
ncbi:MAG: extracellular solute-binding protein [Patescibacteria group bacterium]